MIYVRIRQARPADRTPPEPDPVAPDKRARTWPGQRPPIFSTRIERLGKSVIESKAPIWHVKSTMVAPDKIAAVPARQLETPGARSLHWRPSPLAGPVLVLSAGMFSSFLNQSEGRLKGNRAVLLLHRRVSPLGQGRPINGHPGLARVRETRSQLRKFFCARVRT